MVIIAVDDEIHALTFLEKSIRKAVMTCEVAAFMSPSAALEYARQNAVDIAFLDIEMPGTNGLLLAKQLKDLNPRTNIIFATGHSDYAINAFSLLASGYVVKPVGAEDVKREMENLRYPVFTPAMFPKQGIWVQTFGHFDIYADGRPLIFKLAKSKEILAYLVDRRGSSVEKKELATILWNEDEYTRNRQIYLQKLMSSMRQTLEDAGIADIVMRWSGNLAIDVSKIQCDYYNFINGNQRAIDAYMGEYMTNYGWAEFTAAMLSKQKGLM